MNANARAMQLARDLSERSTIKIKVGAVLFNGNGIFSWGWNNPGDGYGEHAEHMAIRRYLSSYGIRRHSNLLIAVYSSRKGRPITSRPCGKCEPLLRRFGVKGAVHNRKYGEEKDFEVKEEISYYS